MLNGSETLAGLASATGHRLWSLPAVAEVSLEGGARLTTWGELLTRVRYVALGLAAAGSPAAPMALAPDATALDRAVAVLAAAAAGRLVDLDAGVDDGGTPGAGPLAGRELVALATAGAQVDQAEPDRFEALVAGVDPTTELVRSDGATHTHASLLVPARSFAEGAGLEVGDGLLVALPPGLPRLVLGVVVPSLAGAVAWSLGGGVGLPAGLRLARPALAVLTPVGAWQVPPPENERTRRRRRAAGATRVVQVTDGGAGGAAPPPGASAALAVAAAGGLVTAFGPPGSVGRPLPGVSVAIDDDGQVLVRGGGVASEAPGRRGDGWLPTGLLGRLEAGALRLEGAPTGKGAR